MPLNYNFHMIHNVMSVKKKKYVNVDDFYLNT